MDKSARLASRQNATATYAIYTAIGVATIKPAPKQAMIQPTLLPTLRYPSRSRRNGMIGAAME